MPKCPICGSHHDTWGGVATHIWKKTDGDHDVGESKDEATIWLAENDHIAGDTSPDTSADPEPDTSTTSAPDTSDPVTTDGGQSVEFPENPDADAASDPEPDPPVDDDPTDADPVCPKCGPGDVVDATTVLRSRSDLNAEHRELLRTSDYVCERCGGVFDA